MYGYVRTKVKELTRNNREQGTTRETDHKRKGGMGYVKRKYIIEFTVKEMVLKELIPLLETIHESVVSYR